jgi:hypothetical protein
MTKKTLELCLIFSGNQELALTRLWVEVEVDEEDFYNLDSELDLYWSGKK